VPTASERPATVSDSFAMAHRFRGFLPVVVDVETGGFNCKTDALLEIAAVLLEPKPDGTIQDEMQERLRGMGSRRSRG